MLLLLTDGTELTSLEGVAEARGPPTMNLGHPGGQTHFRAGLFEHAARPTCTASAQVQQMRTDLQTSWSHRVDGAQALVLPPGPTLGSELAAAPYRWDQRLFGALLRMPALDAAGAPAFSLGSAAAAAAAAEVPAAESTVAALCEVRMACTSSCTVQAMRWADVHSICCGPVVAQHCNTKRMGLRR